MKNLIKKKVILDGAIVEELDHYNLVTLDNPKYLNAEDDEALLPLEGAIDLSIQSKKNNICVLRVLRLNILSTGIKNIWSWNKAPI